jgi:hypothetical protein
MSKSDADMPEDLIKRVHQALLRYALHQLTHTCVAQQSSGGSM